MAWICDALKRHEAIRGGALEVGALDVNGSPCWLFLDRRRFPWYVGVDMRPGPGVHAVALANLLPIGSGAAGIIVCTEMLEHDERFWESLPEFRRALRPGGHLLVTTRGIHFPRHEFPADYWRFTAEGLRNVMAWSGFEVLEAEADAEDKAVFAIGRNGGAG